MQTETGTKFNTLDLEEQDFPAFMKLILINLEEEIHSKQFLFNQLSKIYANSTQQPNV